MLGWVDARCKGVNAHKFFVSKKGKAQVRRYRNALMEVRAAYSAFDPSIVRCFSLAELAFIKGIPTVIDREITTADAVLTQPSPQPKRDAGAGESSRKGGIFPPRQVGPPACRHANSTPRLPAPELCVALHKSGTQ
jgi:hypothetical protein